MAGEWGLVDDVALFEVVVSTPMERRTKGFFQFATPLFEKRKHLLVSQLIGALKNDLDPRFVLSEYGTVGGTANAGGA